MCMCPHAPQISFVGEASYFVFGTVESKDTTKVKNQSSATFLHVFALCVDIEFVLLLLCSLTFILVLE